MLNIAVIGAGRIGQVHARAVAAHPDATLVTVCDPFEANARALAEAYGIGWTLSPDDVFADEAVDAVIIGSPTAFHVDHILKAVAAGKKVMCEKPIALDLAEAKRCVDELGADADKVMMGFNRRFDPSFAEVNERVAAGEIGELQQLTVISRDPAAPPAEYVGGSGGIFKDMTIHDFDMVRFFLGDISEVTAVGTNFDAGIRDAGDFDQVMVTLKSTTGAMATIVNSRTCAFGYDQRLEAFGSDGALNAENLTATSVRKASATQTQAKSRIMDFFLDRYVAAYSRELGAFIEAAQAGRPASPNVLDGYEALKLADAAGRSAADGRKIVLADD